MHTIITSVSVSPWLWGGVAISVILLWLREAKRQPDRKLTERPRPIGAFAFIFSLSFFLGLLKIKFLAWRYTTPSSWALMSLLLASFAAYREWSKQKPKSPTARS
ncbi:MAG TPA: hypothetical protein VGS05_02605 [Candidatus Sulfotelmatobacter sp.]|nr:hypothetical protein [Candidatus Sulfotelmatobacter sp.]